MEPTALRLGDRVQAYERSRDRMLAASAAAFATWQLAELAASSSSLLRAPLLGLSLVGGFAWIVTMLRSVSLTRRLRRDPALASAAQDERIQAVRARAFGVAFVAVMALQALIVGASSLGAVLSAMAMARITIVVGVVGALVAFVVFGRE